MGLEVMIIGIIAIVSGGKIVRMHLLHKKEREILKHQEKVAMINKGLNPSSSYSDTEITELRDSNQKLLSRVESLESIVTSSEYELNKRLYQLVEKEREESYMKLEQVSQAITGEHTTTSKLSDRYKILEELGRGGMGIVLKAEDTHLNEIVALKLITPQISTDEKVASRFKQEAAASRKITHPNVIRIHDLGEYEGTMYISMEYYLGNNLKDIIKKSEILSLDKTIHYFMQICKGVQAAHDVGIIHRDLKPQNILVNENDQLKIIDFGLAKAAFLQGLTMTGLVVGTPEYMSPEQVSGKEVDYRTDIYSMGIILYEMVTGSVPFYGESPISIGFKHMQEKPALPPEIKTKIPAWLDGVIMKMMAKSQADRYECVRNIIQDVQEQRSPQLV